MAGNTERRNDNMTPSLTAKSNAGSNNDVILWADPATHALLVTGSFSISGLSGSKSNNSAAPTSDNLGALVGVASAAAPTYIEGNQVLLSTDLSGQLRVTGSLSVGGTTDNSAFTAGTSTGTPAMGFYHSTVDSVTDGRAAAVGITIKRAMFTSLYDAAGNAMLGQKTTANSIPIALASDATLAVTNAGTFAVQATLAAETTKVIGTTRTLGNAGAIMDGVNTAATAPANGMLVLGIYNSTEPTLTTGQSVGLQFDSKGRNRNVIMDAAGNTRGANVTAANELLVTGAVTNAGTFAVQAAQSGTWNIGTVTTVTGVTTVSTVTAVTTVSTVTNLAQMNGAALLMGNGVTGTGSQRVTLASDNSAVALWGHGATAAAVPANAVLRGGRGATANPTAVTDGQMVAAMHDKLGKQVVVGSLRDMKADAALTLTASTTETTLIAAIASTFNDLYGLIVTNISATATEVIFRDVTAGTARFSIYVPAGETRGFMLPEGGAYKQATVNTAWTAQCGTSVTSIKISALYVKNT